MPALAEAAAPSASAAVPARAHALAGMALVAAYAACTAGMSMMIKAADARFSIWQIGFLRSAVGLVPLAAIMRRRGVSLASPGWRLLCLRGIWGLSAMVCYFAALREIPLADAALLNFCAPLFTAGLAAVVLGERLSPGDLVWLTAAFGGLWLGLAPSWSGSGVGYAVGLGAGIFSAAAFVTVRAMAGRESPWRVVFYFNAVASLALLGPAAAAWRTPTAGQALWLAGLSLLGTGGQACLTLGYERVEVSRGSVATLLAFAFSALGGWAFWGEAFTARKLMGVIVVTVVVAALSLRSARRPQLDRAGLSR